MGGVSLYKLYNCLIEKNMDLSVNQPSEFSAKEPSLGYLYQIKYGLFLLLSSKDEVNTKLLIESLDDIEIINEETVSLYQTKFHLKTNRNVSDRSVDFWKTMRVWCEQIDSKLINIEETATERISKDSILLDLKNNENESNTEKILESLNKISLEKSNKRNLKGYDAFNMLSENNKKNLINRINIIDSSLNFLSLDKKIKSELRLSALPKHIQPLYESLEGWFLQQSINHLLGEKNCISFDEINRKTIQIIEKFTSNDLPIDFPEKIIDSTEVESEKFKSMLFIKQLNLIGGSKRIKQNAISDYYRAYHQRSKWLHNELLDPQEEIDYEIRLIDDWERKFDLLLDEIDNINADQVESYSMEFYKNYYIRNTPQVFIREKFREAYLALGSSHILAQDLKVGWHPNFKKLKPKATSQ